MPVVHITEYELNKLNNMNNKIPYLKDYEGGSLEDNEQFDINDNNIRESLKLCYVKTIVDHYKYEAHLCFFTEENIEDVWGDDWDDAPYEHNSGTPNVPCLTILAIGVESTKTGHYNSPYSVEEINMGVVPWLTGDNEGHLFAGATVNEFIEFIEGDPKGIYL